MEPLEWLAIGGALALVGLGAGGGMALYDAGQGVQQGASQATQDIGQGISSGLAVLLLLGGSALVIYAVSK